MFVAFAALAATGLVSGALVPQRQQSTAAVFTALVNTDGVLEAEGRTGEAYGATRLGRSVDAHRGLAPEPLLADLLVELGEWTGRPRAAFADHVTLLVLDLRAGETGANQEHVPRVQRR
ncbi:MAG: hypothetical protein A2V74_10145 [Acidobacteria bacterium RBG_16_70_10]|nr:MAG: hypothetical protein A2V74_10145 [Acidobacteria bacterium RBG_16_70_10]